jgi:4'-phosphopantetheinyl transferase
MTAGITLGRGDVHVWSTTSAVDEGDAAAAWKLLTDDERAMARRLRNDDDRALRVQARAARRRVLAAYVGVDPEALSFREGTDGKPELIARPGLPQVRFNVTHSSSVILVAVAPDHEVGVDVERIQTGFPWEQVAGSSLSAAEVAAIRSLSAADRLPAFFACWVRKEAYLKGLGRGLSRPTRDFVVPLGPNGGPVRGPGGPAAVGADWRVLPLEVGRGYAAALATAGEVRVTCRPLAPPTP